MRLSATSEGRCRNLQLNLAAGRCTSHECLWLSPVQEPALLSKKLTSKNLPFFWQVHIHRGRPSADEADGNGQAS